MEPRSSSQPLTTSRWQACDMKSFGDKIQSMMSTLEAAGSAKEAAVRKQLGLAAALEGRVSDARALATRLRESLQVKRANLVAGILEGAAWDSFEVRAPPLLLPSRGSLSTSLRPPGATRHVHEAAGGGHQDAGGDLRLEDHHRHGHWEGARRPLLPHVRAAAQRARGGNLPGRPDGEARPVPGPHPRPGAAAQGCGRPGGEHAAHAARVGGMPADGGGGCAESGAGAADPHSGPADCQGRGGGCGAGAG